MLIYVLIEGIIFYYKFQHVPVLKIPEHPDQTLGTGYDLRYIAAGDSTAVGYGATNSSTTYTNLIVEDLAKNKKVYYRNVAVIGDQTDDLIRTQLQQIIDFKPDIVTISIGANDVTHLKSSKKILLNIKMIIDSILQKTAATIYVTDIPDFSWAQILPKPYRILLEYKDRSLNEHIKQLESDRVKIVDIHDFGWSKFPDQGVTNAADNFHPNDLGYENWASAFLNRINDK